MSPGFLHQLQLLTVRCVCTEHVAHVLEMSVSVHGVEGVWAWELVAGAKEHACGESQTSGQCARARRALFREVLKGFVEPGRCFDCGRVRLIAPSDERTSSVREMP